MWDDYCLMSVYDIIHENSPIMLTELAQKIDETIEITKKYTMELKRLGLIEIEHIQQSDPKKIVKLKKDLLMDKGYNKIMRKINRHLKP